ncbi:dienelactone hydrolase family protein [Sediminibacillus albus]|uniref:Abhydrolase family protein n=1 Tax=Sediminibacillus albus TaxID=407036 RepID=A0A1G8WHN8_9BACI|nr:alpha/beta hydrolase family protein [Sediminibacillus albus]SDJ77613.1 Abhydrolase family protein [Sediminibacillus albus]
MVKSIEHFFEDIFHHAIRQQPEPDWSFEYRTHLKQGLSQALGDFTDWEGEGTVPVVQKVVNKGSYSQELVTFRLPSQLLVSMYILTPLTGQKTYPAVLALHGHGYGPEEIIGIRKDGNVKQTEDLQSDYALQLVKRGIKVFVPTVLGFGERMFTSDWDAGKDKSCAKMAQLLLMAGKTLAGARIWEAARTIDVIEAYNDVQPGRIGVFGFSGGAMVAGYTAALDDRIMNVVLSGYASTFAGSILKLSHCIDNYLPGILKTGELPDLLGLIAPRPLFIEAGQDDPIFPVASVKEAVQQLQDLYRYYRQGNNFCFDLHGKGHQVSGERSYDWLAREMAAQ